MNEFKLTTYNVCNWYPKNYENMTGAKNWMWCNRKERIFDAINKILPDFACFQEIRDLFENGQRQRMLTDFYKGLGNTYDLTYACNSPSALTFVNAIAFKLNKYFLVETYKWWNNPENSDQWGDHPKGNGFGRVTLMAKFYPLAKNEKGVEYPDYKADPIYVVNQHPGLNHEEKMSHHKTTINKISKIVESGHVFICGDFNCFPDDGGDEELSLYVKAGYIDASKNLKTFEGIDAPGTWVGYSYDNFKAPLGKLGTHLDHVQYKWFDKTRKMKTIFSAKTDLNNYLPESKKEMKEIKDYLVGPQGEDLRDSLPSDHSSVTVEARISEQK